MPNVWKDEKGKTVRVTPDNGIFVNCTFKGTQRFSTDLGLSGTITPEGLQFDPEPIPVFDLVIPEGDKPVR